MGNSKIHLIDQVKMRKVSMAKISLTCCVLSIKVFARFHTLFHLRPKLDNLVCTLTRAIQLYLEMLNVNFVQSLCANITLLLISMPKVARCYI